MTLFDLGIIPAVSGQVSFTVQGRKADSGLQLMQRIWTLLLSGHSSYRERRIVDFLGLLEGKNQPPDGALDSVLAVACASVLVSLDSSDREVIKSLSGTYSDGHVVITLVLKDGTRIVEAW